DGIFGTVKPARFNRLANKCFLVWSEAYFHSASVRGYPKGVKVGGPFVGVLVGSWLDDGHARGHSLFFLHTQEVSARKLLQRCTAPLQRRTAPPIKQVPCFLQVRLR